jgi:hypothetical protein
VQRLDDGTYREKRILIRQSVNKKTHTVVEMGRSPPENGGLFRLAEPGEAPTDNLIEIGPYELRALVRIEPAPWDDPTKKSSEHVIAPKKKKGTSAPAPKEKAPKKGKAPLIVVDSSAAPESSDSPPPTQEDETPASDPPSEGPPIPAFLSDEDPVSADEASVPDATEDPPEQQVATETEPDGSEKVEVPAAVEENTESSAPKKKKAKSNKEVSKKTSKKAKSKTGKAKVPKVAAEKAKAPKAPKPKKEKAAKPAKVAKQKASREVADSSEPREGKLNAKELKVLSVLADDGGQLTIADLASKTFEKKEGSDRANSWVRNSLRRLWRDGLIEKVDRGTYKSTVDGKKKAKAA